MTKPHSTGLSPDALRELSRRLAEQGKLIEAGWIGLRAAAIPADAPQLQLDEMRNAFFAGAQHLFSSIMTILDTDREPTEGDLRKMDQIQQELDAFITAYTAQNLPTEGSA